MQWSFTRYGMIFNVLGPWNLIFFFFIFYIVVSSFFLQSLKTDCYREKNLSRQPFGRKLKIWRLNPLFTLSFLFVSLRSHRSDFRNISEIKGIFYCIIFTLRNSGSYLHTFKLLVFSYCEEIFKISWLLTNSRN